MADVTEGKRKIATTVAEAFGGEPRVQRFWDEPENSCVDILKCIDRPVENVTSYSTIGLSDMPLYNDGLEYPARLEMVGACQTRFTDFDNALATAAFCVINSKWFCYPGAVFKDILSMYEVSSSMRHFFFVSPFLWEDSLKTIKIGDKTVAWLLAVPISDGEMAYCDDHGGDALESLFEEKQIDVFDLSRDSVA